MLVDRVMGVLRLDADTFEEIEHDPNALSEAAIVVTVVALLSAIGQGIGASNFIPAFLSSLVWAYIGWFIWAVVTYFVGTSLFQGKADIPEMLRVLGYAQAPRVVGILSFIPCVGFLIAILAWVWALVAAFIAVRQGLDVDNVQAAITVLVGWFVIFVGSLLIGVLLGGVSLGLGALTG